MMVGLSSDDYSGDSRPGDVKYVTVLFAMFLKLSMFRGGTTFAFPPPIIIFETVLFMLTWFLVKLGLVMISLLRAGRLDSFGFLKFMILLIYSDIC